MEEKLEATLLACTTPDTGTIRQAEESLHRQLRGKSSVPLLVKTLHGSQHIGVRQLAAVLLRLKLGMHWIKLSVQDQEFCKKALLECLFKENIRTVRLGVCYAISSLARHQLTMGPSGWPDLLMVIKQATSDSQNSEIREMGYLLMYTLTETIGTSLSSSLPEVASQFSQALQTETDSKVYSAILRASSGLIEFLVEEDNVMLFQPIVVPLLTALTKGDFGHDDFAINTVVQVLEVISNMSESPLPILDPFVVQTCEVLSLLIISRNVNESIRGAAATALSDVINCKTRLVAKNPSAYKAALRACLELSRETAENSGMEHDDEPLEDDDDVSLRSMTEMVISSFANNLPTKLVVENLVNSAATLILNQDDQIGREAGLIVLIVASEGIAGELVESHASAFDNLVTMVMDCVTRPQQTIGTTRHALILLSQWAEYLWPLMETHASVVIPAAVRLSSTYHPRIFVEANMVLQQYCGAMEEDEVAPYITDICGAAIGMFGQARASHSPNLIRSAIETLSYASVAAGAKFAPFFDQCMRIVTPLMSLEGQDFVEVRAHATALMGQLAVVSTKCTPKGMPNPFLPFVPQLVGKCFEMLEKDVDGDLDLRDSIHHLFGNVAIALGIDVEQFLPQMIDVLVEDAVADTNDVCRRVVDRDGASHIPDSLKAIATEDGDDHANASSDDAEDDDDDEANGNIKVLTSVREAAADSKASSFAALETICDVFSLSELPNDVVARSTAANNLDRTINICCLTIETYLHPQVRSNAVSTLGSAILLMYKAELPTALALPPTDELRAFATANLLDSDFDLRWLPTRVNSHLVPHTQHVMDETVLPFLLESMTSDTSKVVAAKACETIERIAQLTGPTLFASEPSLLFESLATLLDGQASCQKNDENLKRSRQHQEDEGDHDDDEIGDEEDDERRHDEILTDSIVEALASTAKALGRAAFAPHLKTVLPALLKRARPRMPLKDRIDAVGCLSQILNVTGLVEGKSGSKIAQLALEAIKQNDDLCLKRNGLVLCGVLVNHGDKHLNPVNMLSVLKPIFEEQAVKGTRKWEVEDNLAVLDNACSLIARILRRSEVTTEMRNLVLREFLPLLPLRYDHDEDWIVYSTLGPLAETCDQSLLAAYLDVCYKAVDDVTGRGSLPAFLQLCDVVIRRIGLNNVNQEFVQKLMAKKNSMTA